MVNNQHHYYFDTFFSSCKWHCNVDRGRKIYNNVLHNFGVR